MDILTEESLSMLNKCIDFLNHIGIKTICVNTEEAGFLPGLIIKDGEIIVNKTALKYPGDILHEAGHIAVVPAADRQNLNEKVIGERKDREAEEMMAIAWSYAACIHLQIDPDFVFHNDGYKGGGSYIVDNFRDKQYFGLPMLQWVGLTYDESNAVKNDTPPYPHMIKWLRD